MFSACVHSELQEKEQSFSPYNIVRPPTGTDCRAIDRAQAHRNIFVAMSSIASRT
eukprot:COSAG05_NODE_1041_length_6067_cov_116.470845_3_plen_55_part_00